ncbi:DUF6230 family protein [Streptomyces noursei]|uniref:DUF6230 family protein n=1 Tax=Streptomyces noursei TaxID=1971 RepID=UPI001677E50A|nr:DUF6230 family protein [Streptomyces noursei]MCZ1014080.1 DUF6230 family protein [Streptomyces noursei]GGX54243.1 hypothetical protein GCM10010341_89230 [Streptomyces noursei]
MRLIRVLRHGGKRHRPPVRPGQTDWRRFTIAALAALALGAGTIATTTAASIPLSFAVAGSPFSVTAQRLKATGAVQFASFRKDATGRKHAVAVVGIREAALYGLCQSAVAHTPLGTATLLIRSGEDEPVTASQMTLDLARLEGDMSFGAVEMGRDAAALDASGTTGTGGVYGQQARTLTIKDLRVAAWSLTAGMFSLNGATMDVHAGDHPCS